MLDLKWIEREGRQKFINRDWDTKNFLADGCPFAT